MSKSKEKIRPQILFTCRTHEMIKQEFPEYNEPDCPVSHKKFHTTLGILETKLQANGFQLYIGNNVNYEDYVSMLKYIVENPLSEEVFKKMQNEVLGDLNGMIIRH